MYSTSELHVLARLGFLVLWGLPDTHEACWEDEDSASGFIVWLSHVAARDNIEVICKNAAFIIY